MQYRFLGQTGIRISQLGYGTMGFGDSCNLKMSRTLFNRCRDAGINHFDCADVYAGGRSEAILGELIEDCRDEIVLATKAYFPTGSDVNARGGSRFHLVRAVEASLRRLKTDRIDLFYLHRFDDSTDLASTLRALEDLVRQGKILHLAASNFAAWQVARALGHAERLGFEPICCIQPMYNLAKRAAEIELLPMAHAESLAVIPYGPLGGGLLSGKYGARVRPGSGRLVDNPMYTTRYQDPQNYEIAERFVALARAWGHHPATLAIAWVASHPAVTAPLIGARNLEQLAPLLAAADLELSHEQREQIASLAPEPPPATDRNEETSAHNYGSR